MMKFIYTIAFLTALSGINLNAQCFPDRHNTSWYDGWISCEKSNNPNPVHGKSHWILYDLNYSYLLGKMHIWNTNAPDYLADGIKTAAIDVSMDGVNWTGLGQFDFEQGSGKSNYEGFEGPDLGGVEARYLLITALSNRGGYCYGLSELKVEVLGVTSAQQPGLLAERCLHAQLFPNPATTVTRLNVYSVCSNELITWEIQDLSGRVISKGNRLPVNDHAFIDLQISDLVQGSYILQLFQNGLTIREKLVKL